jgi:hypothetical protein
LTNSLLRGLGNPNALLRALLTVTCLSVAAHSQATPHPRAAAEARPAPWRPATDTELHTLLPARAPVVSEKIETEFRASSGITNDRGRSIAGVLLITAGYSAEGKYSYYLITQVSLKVGEVTLPPGQYLFGWVRTESSLQVTFYEAPTGKPLGTVEAKLDPSVHRVESFRIWTPNSHSVMQLGRFTFPYKLVP